MRVEPRNSGHQSLEIIGIHFREPADDAVEAGLRENAL
jgi:hypothetical protein